MVQSNLSGLQAEALRPTDGCGCAGLLYPQWSLSLHMEIFRTGSWKVNVLVCRFIINV